LSAAFVVGRRHCFSAGAFSGGAAGRVHMPIDLDFAGTPLATTRWVRARLCRLAPRYRNIATE
jgi:hypothetical protein